MKKQFRLSQFKHMYGVFYDECTYEEQFFLISMIAESDLEIPDRVILIKQFLVGVRSVDEVVKRLSERKQERDY